MNAGIIINTTTATNAINNSPAYICDAQNTAFDLHLSPHWKKTPWKDNTALEKIWLWGQTVTDLYLSSDPYQTSLNNASNTRELGLFIYKMGIPNSIG